MSAVKTSQHMSTTLPLSQMTMPQLDQELAFWTAEIASDERWGISAEITIEMRLEVEAEMGVVTAVGTEVVMAAAVEAATLWSQLTLAKTG